MGNEKIWKYCAACGAVLTLASIVTAWCGWIQEQAILFLSNGLGIMLLAMGLTQVVLQRVLRGPKGTNLKKKETWEGSKVTRTALLLTMPAIVLIEILCFFLGFPLPALLCACLLPLQSIVLIWLADRTLKKIAEMQGL